MERLLGNFNNRSRDPAEGFVKPGDRVSMRKGPLAMFEAIVKWSDRNQVGLTFSMLGRQSSVTTTLENVQPV
jgi:transcription antitermination factor NusG